jgi:hypothetical protein
MERVAASGTLAERSAVHLSLRGRDRETARARQGGSATGPASTNDEKGTGNFSHRKERKVASPLFCTTMLYGGDSRLLLVDDSGRRLPSRISTTIALTDSYEGKLLKWAKVA